MTQVNVPLIPLSSFWHRKWGRYWQAQSPLITPTSWKPYPQLIPFEIKHLFQVPLAWIVLSLSLSYWWFQVIFEMSSGSEHSNSISVKLWNVCSVNLSEDNAFPVIHKSYWEIHQHITNMHDTFCTIFAASCANHVPPSRHACQLCEFPVCFLRVCAQTTWHFYKCVVSRANLFPFLL